MVIIGYYRYIKTLFRLATNPMNPPWRPQTIP